MNRGSRLAKLRYVTRTRWCIHLSSVFLLLREHSSRCLTCMFLSLATPEVSVSYIWSCKLPSGCAVAAVMAPAANSSPKSRVCYFPFWGCLKQHLFEEFLLLFALFTEGK
ncbi:unnamed protein product [Polarella glacialis]|uniref:Uncharacterized protein n=1 Tax=Polarella glacialis TaxID=89957 RepID=A0A813J440_POLGL|nr:unnamed protein product [Polarella glacialis]